jgi:stage V sporulation protein D (sporulation-specific penicillin-binding protein)
MAVRGEVRGAFVRRRIEKTFLLVLACYLALIGRLVYLQGYEGPLLRSEAIHNRQQKIVIRSHRGSICDRDGKLLAVSLYAGKVGFDPTALKFDGEDPKRRAKDEQALARNIRTVAAILKVPAEEVNAIVQQGRTATPAKPVRFIPIMKGVDLDTAQKIREAHPKLIGFGVDDGTRRFYACGENAAHVVGVLGGDSVGASGLERTYQRWLQGVNGFAVVQVDDLLREIPGTTQRIDPARDGYDVFTTLDTNAQQIATEEARRVADLYHPAGISIVVVDPSNGDVLALVSMPTFDPNPGQRRGVDTKLLPEMMRERCASTLYEPGSTLKSLTIASALDSGVINMNSQFFCSGQLPVGNKVIHCVLHGATEAGGHGQETPQDILRHSCNVGAAQIGMKMGPDLLFEYMNKFGLFDPLYMGLPAEQYGRLSFDKTENVHSMAKVARVAFGHSITTTPLHVAMAYAALANDGVLMRPRLVSCVKDSNGATVKSWAPVPIRRVVSSQTSRQMMSMLQMVVTNGTGKVAAIPGYMVAGKTGTANKYHRGKYVGSFIGIMPASMRQKPRAVILVAVDEPKGAYYGAEVAAPAFQAIARRLLACWRVPEDDPKSEQAKEAVENLRRTGALVPPTLKTIAMK